jgi:hypothetical protein
MLIKNMLHKKKDIVGLIDDFGSNPKVVFPVSSGHGQNLPQKTWHLFSEHDSTSRLLGIGHYPF